VHRTGQVIAACTAARRVPLGIDGHNACGQHRN
jgi:hypothetical protein